MLNTIDNFISNKWSTLIGRPRLTLTNQKCGNIVCNAEDLFKKYSDNYYICKCGFEIKGEFNEIKHKISLFCGISSCIENKSKMDLDCIKCQYIRER